MKKFFSILVFVFIALNCFGQFTIVSKPAINKQKVVGFNGENVYFVNDTISYYTISTYRTYYFDGHIDQTINQSYVEELKFYNKAELVNFINSCHDIWKNKLAKDNYISYENNGKIYNISNFGSALYLIIPNIYYFRGSERECDTHCGYKTLQISYILQMKDKYINKIEKFEE